MIGTDVDQWTDPDDEAFNGQMGESLTEPGDGDYGVSRTSRRIKFVVTAEVEYEVIEPPVVHNAHLKAEARQRVFHTLSNLGWGVPSKVNVEVRNARPSE